MEHLTKYLPLIVLVALLCCLLLFLYTNSRLTEAINRLETAEAKIDSSILAMTVAQTTVDSVQRELIAFGSYVQDIQGRVEILDLSRRAESDRFRNQQSAISGRLKTLYQEVGVTGGDLPEIPVVNGSTTQAPSKKHQ